MESLHFNQKSAEMSKYEKFQLDGVEYKTLFTKKWENRKIWKEPNPFMLETYIPGTILHIHIKEGQEVAEDEILITLQAMKMENKVQAPFPGKIKKIYVNAGDKVPKGTLMIEME